MTSASTTAPTVTPLCPKSSPRTQTATWVPQHIFTMGQSVLMWDMDIKFHQSVATTLLNASMYDKCFWLCKSSDSSVINHAIQKLHLYFTWIGLALNAWRNMGQARYCKCYSQMHLTSECQLNIHEIRPQKSRIFMFQSTLVSCFTCSIIEPLMRVRYTSLPSNTFSYIHSSSTSSKVLCPNAVSVSHQCMWLSWDLSLTKNKRNLTSKFRSNWKHSNLEELYYSFIGTMVKKGAVIHYNVLL